LSKSDQEISENFSFRICYNHFENIIMLFGFINVLEIFQYIINDIFQDFLDIFLIIYLDDMLIYFR
jgi:hypothetical protein